MTSEFVLPEGAQLSVICYLDSTPRTFHSEVEKGRPLTLKCNAEWCGMLDKGARAMLVYQEGDSIQKAETTVRARTQRDDSWVLQLGEPKWELVDQRRHPRHPAELLAQVRIVSEQDGSPVFETQSCKTVDLSLGGCWIATTSLPAQGALIEVQLHLSYFGTIRAMGVVAWSDANRGGFGVEFLDYIGSARYYLHQFLQRAA